MEFNLAPGSFTVEQNFKPLEENTLYDVMIIGGGPAGLTAAVYCMRKGVSTAMVVKDIGGQVAETAGIENYLGFKFINGMELAGKFKEQVLQFGIAFEEGAAVASISDGTVKKVVLQDGRVFTARTLIITTGKSWRKLNVPGEDDFVGRGVAYCATCDAPFFAGKRVAVVGGGNSGLEAALDLAKIAEHVYIVQFLENLTADRILIDRMEATGRVEVLLGHEVVEVKGEDSVSSVVVRDRKSGKTSSLDVQGIFVEIGLVPNTDPVMGVVERNEFGEIIIDCACKTSAPGIFAAGDVTTVPFKQIIIAGGEGAKAALSACEYILKEGGQ